jgi:hypothetical protein
VRALSPVLLDRWDETGPSLEMWNKWWQICDKAGIRLEDCTGGNLFQKFDDVNGEDSSDESEEAPWGRFLRMLAAIKNNLPFGIPMRS